MQTRILYPPTVLALAALLAGCGGGGSTTTPLFVSARTPEGLRATLAQAQATVPTSGTIQYTLTLTNPTAAPVSYTGQVYNSVGGPDIPLFPGSLALTDSDGKTAFPGSQSAIVRPLHPVTVTLQPGQSLSETQAVQPAEFNNAYPAAQPGQYRAVATFTTSGVNTATPPLTVTVR